MIVVRLVAEAVAIGLSADPSVFGEMRASDWVARRVACGRWRKP